MAVALEWQTEDRVKCGGCGHPLDETTDPANENAYEAEARICHACAASGRVRRQYQDGKGEMAGAMFPAWKTEG